MNGERCKPDIHVWQRPMTEAPSADERPYWRCQCNLMSVAEVELLASGGSERIAALETENARLRAVGADLARNLQGWVDDAPDKTWCYSETALAAWREVTGQEAAENGDNSDTSDITCEACQEPRFRLELLFWGPGSIDVPDTSPRLHHVKDGLHRFVWDRVV